MRTTIRSRASARWAGRLLIAILTASCASVALAQISEYDEPPPSVHPHALARPAPEEPQAAPAPDYRDLPNPAPVRHAAPAARSVAAPASRSSSRGTEFPYIVRPGDSLGSIAATFGLGAQDLARANHIGMDTVLMTGKTLRIPNPFAAQVRSLTAQVDQLRAAAAKSDELAAATTLKGRSSDEKLESLAADNAALRSETAALPRWRGTAVTFAIVALLMFGVTMVTLFEWWLLRQRFAALAAVTDSLTNLDQKYKRIIAKAELRFQQIYGRRRAPGAETQERVQSAEEIEIERLNHELREALEHQLRRLGVAPSRPRRTGRWREALGDVEPPVEARSVRR
ncbi:MAG TPA: LysM peptidoglycan-binding domain-containing protein [Candidatus Binataceae bacterium]|nr:LysM peptidoglycan-binding domain-containing protein [Candidatus Binataceae bacterium]